MRAASAPLRAISRWSRLIATPLCISALVASVVLGVASSAAATDGSGVKPIIHGLIDRQGVPPRAMLPLVHAYVVKVNWANLQPSAGGPIAADNAIDRAITRVRKPDFAALGMVLKLRVFAGIGAPTWAKSLGGAPIPYLNNQDDSTLEGGTIGRFWTPAFEAAYATLQSELAAKYDDVPELRELTISGCTTIFDEPFVRQVGVTANRDNLLAAGYTVAADQACIPLAIAAHNVWQRTTSDLDLAPWPTVTDPHGRDLDFPLSMMDLCRTELGPRCGLQNNSLSSDKLAAANFDQLYAAMVARGGTLVFQTAACSRLGDAQEVLDAASQMGADSVELPTGYQYWSYAMLQTAAQSLSATGPAAAVAPTSPRHRHAV